MFTSFLFAMIVTMAALLYLHRQRAVFPAVVALAAVFLCGGIIKADEQLAVDMAYARANADIAARKAKAEIGLPSCGSLECKVAERKADDAIHLALAERRKSPHPAPQPTAPTKGMPTISPDGLTFTDATGRIWRRSQPHGPFLPATSASKAESCPNGKCPSNR